MTSPGGREVGRLSIRVVPNTSRFRTDLKLFLERVERTARSVRIQVELDDSRIGAGLKRLEDNVRKSSRGGIGVEAHPELRAGFREELQAMVATASAGVGITIPVDLDEKGIRDFNNEVGRSRHTIVNVNRSGGMMSRMFRGFFRMMTRGGQILGETVGTLMGIPATMGQLGAAMGKGVGAVAMLGVAAVGVTGAVGALAGVILAAAGAVGALAAAAPTLLALGPPIAAVMLGMDGIKKAVEPLAPAFERMKGAVSAAFEIGLAHAVEHINTIMPMLTDELVNVASRLSMVADEAAVFLSSAQGIRIIKDIFAGFGIVLDRTKAGMGELAKQVLITAGHAPLLRVLGDIINNMTTGLAAWLARARETGRATAAFAALRDILAAAGRWLGDLVDAGMEFLSAAAPGISRFFDNLRNAFSQVDFRSLGEAFGNMVASFGNFDPGTIQRFFENAAVFFQKVADFINAGHLNDFIDGINNLAGGINNVVEAFRAVNEFFKPVSDFLNMISGQSTKAGESAAAAGPKFQEFSHQAQIQSQQASDSWARNVGKIPPASEAAGAGASNRFQVAIAPITGTAHRIGQQTTGNITSGLKPIPPLAERMGRNAKNGFRGSIAPMPGEAGGIARDTSGRIEGGLRDGIPGAEQAGEGMMSGLRDKISAGSAGVITAAVNVALAAWRAAKNALGISSPSRLFMALGDDTIAGFIIGLRKKISDAVGTFQDLAKRMSLGGWEDIGVRMAQRIASGLNSTLPSTVDLRGVSDDVQRQLRAAGGQGGPAASMATTFGPVDQRSDLYSAVFDALNGAQLHVDGRGVAKLVNQTNLRDRVR